MAQLKVSVPDFRIVSTYTCTTQKDEEYNSSHTAVIDTMYALSADTPTTATINKTFEYSVPNGATVTGAKICVDVGTPTMGADLSSINGVVVGVSNSVTVDVALPDGENSVTVPFVYKCHATKHNHATDGTGASSSYWNGHIKFSDYRKTHTSELKYTNVYLLIEYTPPIDFTGWTDDPLQAGETPVKAVHMTELQEWAALLSDYANNGVPTFTPAVPGETSLGLWLTQINEIRSVLDTIYPEHEAWIAVEVNCPRVDVMAQMRAVIVAAMQ